MSSSPQAQRASTLVWGWAAFAWSVLILISVPMARGLQGWVKATVGRQAYLVVVLVLLALAVMGGAVAVWRACGRDAWRRLPWLLISGGVAATYAWHLRHSPEEALHFVEYGVLGLLLFRALRHRVADFAVFPAALLLGTAFGMVDECVQWLVPGRFWDLRDVFVDGLAVGLALVGLAGGLRPPELSRRPGRRTLRCLCGLAAAMALFLGLALSNTPPRTVALGRLVPPLGYLVDYGAVMTEYGFLHQVPGVGGLYSRLSWDELLEQDTGRAGEVARILDGYPSTDDYKLFLRDYPPFGDPFVHELRVHLFRRDRYLERLASEQISDAERRRMATTAWAEDALLDACCSVTVAASSYALSSETWEPYEALIDADGAYVSAVSSHLIRRFRAWQAWGLIGMLWVALLAIVIRPTIPWCPPSP